MVYSYNTSYSHPTSAFLHSMKSFIPPSLQPFLTLSYPIHSPSTTSHVSHLFHSDSPGNFSSNDEVLYDKGLEDAYFVAFCAIAFTVLRECLIRGVFRPFADWWLRSISINRAKRKSNGKLKEGSVNYRESRKEKKKREHTSLRFGEQGWSFVYCTVFWSMGMAILLRIPSPLSPETLWTTYPVIHLPALTKFYYLAQLGWWFHQIFVINTEKRRQDHWQMFSHHILTIGLLVASYGTNFTRVGVVVHVFMDFCDILLPLAKMFRYLSLTTLCDATFVIFLISWLFSRELGLLFVLHSLIFLSPTYITHKWEPSTGWFSSENALFGYMLALGSLWIMATIWFYMAIMVAVRVIKGLGAEDSRSDDEDDGEDGEETEGGASEKDELEKVPDAHAHEHKSSGTALSNGISNGELKKRR